ncbi:MAG: hypothetical protein SGI77_25250 [Pirellulaceae bacterium]|nr:hypothetical protein [Pirellulaceae bacterium]
MVSRNAKRLADSLGPLQVDYAQQVGSSMKGCFYCPILFEDVYRLSELCWGHAVPDALGGKSTGVPQLARVDSFFGSVFEGDCKRHATAQTTTHLEALINKQKFGELQPTILWNERVFRPIPLKTIPSQSTGLPGYLEIHLDGRPSQFFGLKGDLKVDEKMALTTNNFEVLIEQDSRAAHAGMALHSAHLTMFKLRGYSYALSTSGRYFGGEVLGRFFRDSRGDHGVGKKRAVQFATEFKNFWRPVRFEQGVESSVDDRLMLLCFDVEDRAWAIGVFIQASTGRVLVLVPTMHCADSAAKAINFKRKGAKNLVVRRLRLREDQTAFEINPESTTLEWPDASL